MRSHTARSPARDDRATESQLVPRQRATAAAAILPPTQRDPDLPQSQVVPMKVGVARETAAGERRVALVPEALGKLQAAGLEILVETGAGAGALIPDQAYADAGATIVSTVELYAQSDAILRVQKPSADEVKVMRSGQAVVGFLAPLIDPKTSEALAKQGVTAISLDAIPRTLSRAQSMDALSSQANVGGYKAVLIAAESFGRYFPLLTTAAGTAKPANVLILGIGVAGLQAIGTAKRLGAVVKAYDVRAETKEQAQSLGAQFLVLKSVADASGEGGYARQLTPGGAGRPAAGAQRPHRDDGRRDHDRPGPGPAPAAARDEGRGRRHEAGLRHRRHGRQRARRQRRAEQGRRDDRHRQRRHDHRPGEPAGDDAGRRIGVLRPEHLRVAARDGQGRRAQPRLRERGHEGDRHQPTAARSSRRRRRSCSSPHPPRPRREVPREPELLAALTVFVLAILVGFAVISKVPATLHTPLMSGANSIHGIVLVGAMIIAVAAHDPISQAISFVAVAFATMNVVGGYVVTDRMLQMFRRKPAAPKPADEPEA